MYVCLSVCVCQSVFLFCLASIRLSLQAVSFQCHSVCVSVCLSVLSLNTSVWFLSIHLSISPSVSVKFLQHPPFRFASGPQSIFSEWPSLDERQPGSHVAARDIVYIQFTRVETGRRFQPRTYMQSWGLFTLTWQLVVASRVVSRPEENKKIILHWFRSTWLRFK